PQYLQPSPTRRSSDLTFLGSNGHHPIGSGRLHLRKLPPTQRLKSPGDPIFHAAHRRIFPDMGQRTIGVENTNAPAVLAILGLLRSEEHTLNSSHGSIS